MAQIGPIAQALEGAVADGVFPGAVLLARCRGRLVVARAVGVTSSRTHEPVTLETVYDLASLTKPLATATAVLRLVQDGSASLDDPLHRYLPELIERPVGAVSLTRLLSHSAGLPGWQPLYEAIAARDRAEPGFLGSEAARRFMVDAIASAPLAYPPGTQSVYSDLGFILLGAVVERVSGCRLSEFCRDRIFGPLGAAPLGFGPPAQDGSTKLRAIAPTEDSAWRGGMLQGTVHDDNAYALGGVAGHAGLFGGARAVLTVAGAWLSAYHGEAGFLSPTWARHFVTRRADVPGSSWALGWDTPTPPSSSGRYFSAHSFGHLGFTGTSLWIDPLPRLEVVLLSNRVHPTRANAKIQQFRPLIHDLIYETVIGGGM
ncbi:serine hydrolase domain-containing protein [Candidatus Nitrospira bockiana]